MFLRLRQERGSTLALALGILVALSVSTVAVIQYASSSSRSADYGEAGSKAFAIAEAGVNAGASILAENGSVDSGSQTFENGSVSWSGSALNASETLWRVTATSTVPNPTGGAPVSRTLTRDFEITYEPGLNAGNQAWNYLYAESLELCSEFQNSFATSAPVFIRGDLCLQNSAAVEGGVDTAVQVGGTITLEGSSHIGSADAEVEDLAVGVGCSTSDDGPWEFPCTSAHSVYATSVSSTPGDLAKPPVDLEGWYTNAKPGPVNDCITGSFPGGFDNDYPTNTTPNTSLGSVYLLASSYDCQFDDGSTQGRIAYDDSTQTFTIDGVVFIDGNLELDSDDHVVYSGTGVIYSSGKITIKNNTWLCGIADCDTTGWDPNSSMLTFVAGTSTDSDGFLIQNFGRFQGAVYAVNDFHQQNDSRSEGPVIARRLLFENGGYADKWVPLTGLNNGMPAVGSEPVMRPAPGSWSG